MNTAISGKKATLKSARFDSLLVFNYSKDRKKIRKEMESGMGGQIRRINLATFLQMSEQERSTCAPSITAKNKAGRLYMENGALVDGQTEGRKGKDAVYEIIQWDNVIIEIETYSLKRKNVINTPLLNILLEGLKRKDEHTETRASETLVTHDFEVKAKAIYEQYLTRFPDGKNVAAVRQHLVDLTGGVEEAQYQQLLTTHFDTRDQKVQAYKNHLIHHPKGKYRKEVELFLVLETEERYETIKKQLEICDRKREWSASLSLCNSFIALFGNAYRTNEVKNIRDTVFIKPQLMELRQRADKIEPDHAAVKTLYLDYLARNPNFPDKQAIQEVRSTLFPRKTHLPEVSCRAYFLTFSF